MAPLWDWRLIQVAIKDFLMDAVGLTFGLLGANSSTGGYQILSFSSSTEEVSTGLVTVRSAEFDKPISSVIGWAGWYIDTESNTLTNAVKVFQNQIASYPNPIFFAPYELGVAYSIESSSTGKVTPCNLTGTDNFSFSYTPGVSNTLRVQSFRRNGTKMFRAICAYLYIIF